MSKPLTAIAFSGGLDTSWCVPWLVDQGHDVLTVTVDVKPEPGGGGAGLVGAAFGPEDARRVARDEGRPSVGAGGDARDGLPSGRPELPRQHLLARRAVDHREERVAVAAAGSASALSAFAERCSTAMKKHLWSCCKKST